MCLVYTPELSRYPLLKISVIWSSMQYVYTLNLSCLSCTLHIDFNQCSSTGVLCQSFSPPTGEICPGDYITFTCSAGAATFWTVSPGGVDNECAYRSGNPAIDRCGPGDRFTSGPTGDGDNTISSLSVDSITVDLNGTLVECTNAGGNLIGSDSIFIVGTIL